MYFIYFLQIISYGEASSLTANLRLKKKNYSKNEVACLYESPCEEAHSYTFTLHLFVHWLLLVSMTGKVSHPHWMKTLLSVMSVPSSY